MAAPMDKKDFLKLNQKDASAAMYDLLTGVLSLCEKLDNRMERMETKIERLEARISETEASVKEAVKTSDFVSEMDDVKK